MRIRSIATALIAFIAIAGCNKEPAATETAEAKGAAKPAAAAGSRWTENVIATADGGFRMGNPNAKVKLIEYASLTCPHCADFATKAMPVLRQKYVATGQVSVELRNFVRDPIDVTQALLSRCGGARPYFKLTEQMFANLPNLVKNAQFSDADQKALAALPPGQQFQALAKKLGLDAFVAQRGIPAAKANQCLADKASLDKLVAMRNQAMSEFNLTGTPTFVINGRKVEDAATWEQLEPAIRSAL